MVKTKQNKTKPSKSKATKPCLYNFQYLSVFVGDGGAPFALLLADSLVTDSLVLQRRLLWHLTHVCILTPDEQTGLLDETKVMM